MERGDTTLNSLLIIIVTAILYKLSTCVHVYIVCLCVGGGGSKGLLTIACAGINECSIVCFNELVAHASLLLSTMKLWLHLDTDS